MYKVFPKAEAICLFKLNNQILKLKSRLVVKFEWTTYRFYFSDLHQQCKYLQKIFLDLIIIKI